MKDFGESIRNLHMTDGVFAKEYTIPAGSKLVQHKHAYAHLAILAKGECIISMNGYLTRGIGPFCFEIPAEKHHGVSALTDCTWFCIHATEHAEKDTEELLVEPDKEEADRILAAL